MGDSIQPRFFEEFSSIDKDSTAVLADDTTGCLLSSPSTTTYSKMQLKNYRQSSSSPSSRTKSSMRTTDFERRVVACRQTSRELQLRLNRSISSMDSDPGMIDDPFATPKSDTSFEDIYSHNPSAVDVASEKLWREYPLEDVKASLFETPSYTDFTSELHYYGDTDGQCSPRSRSPLSPETFRPYSSELHRSDAIRTTRDRSRTIHVTKTQPVYKPFPTPAPDTTSGALPPTSHQSWPQRKDSKMKRPTARPRAKTAPSQPRANGPSNLNVCVPVNNDIQYLPPTSYSLSHRSAPPTPMVLPDDIVEQFVSQFDEDDDEDDDKADFFGSLSRLCRRGSSNASGSLGKKSTMEKQKKHPRKSLSEIRDALKCCFGKCK